MILPVWSLRKCAIFPLLRPVQAQNRAGDLPQGHFRNIAHRAAQDGQGFRGVKVIDMGEILAAEIVHGVDAAPGHAHIAVEDIRRLLGRFPFEMGHGGHLIPRLVPLYGDQLTR